MRYQNRINTDITDISRHKVGITLFSPLLTYVGIVNNCYLVSFDTDEGGGYETVMFPVQLQLAICYFEGEKLCQAGNG